MTALRQRPGDQPLPVQTSGPGMHDLVITDMINDPALRQVAEALEDRRRVGLERYGSLLQAHNGRDVLRDLAEELLDAIVYARQAMVEGITLRSIWDVEPQLWEMARIVLEARAAQGGSQHV
jgi:hypothetical protein